ncbi:MAG: PLP-dependent transferase [Acidobacteria bacterium]|nr:PLP-dependent transferase [Acidobacteriota bacterium]
MPPGPRRRIETLLVHAGERGPAAHDAVAMPVYQSAMFRTAGGEAYDDIRYIRLNNTPNHVALGEKLAALEGAQAALVTASGMAAITTVLLELLAPGDHLLAQRCLYGGTHDFVSRDLPRLGIEVGFVDAADPGSWERALRPRTRVLYLESIANPLLEVGRLDAVPAFARAHGLVSVIDNTFATPVNFRPLELGFDLSLHSGTKYLNGHSDIVAGVVAGPAALVERLRVRLNRLGGTLDPHACFLLQRGVKTLALRVARQNESALALARFLARQPAVARVYHPGLPGHPGHDSARELFDGFGGMVSFELAGGTAAADRFLQSVTLPVVAPSLGGLETLVTIPARTSHAGMDPDERRAAGIADGLLRVSVGIEALEDLLDDFGRALAAAGEV